MKTYPDHLSIDLTKREYFAAMAMQGIIASYAGAMKLPTPEDLAKESVMQADALIAALNADQTQERKG